MDALQMLATKQAFFKAGGTQADWTEYLGTQIPAGKQGKSSNVIQRDSKMVIPFDRAGFLAETKLPVEFQVREAKNPDPRTNQRGLYAGIPKYSEGLSSSMSIGLGADGMVDLEKTAQNCETLRKSANIALESANRIEDWVKEQVAKLV